MYIYIGRLHYISRAHLININSTKRVADVVIKNESMFVNTMSTYGV